jgi:poly(hydroxyalkanoate) granule-associated protein
MLKKARAQAKAEAEQARSEPDTQGKDLADSVLDSSRQIWLAGLGAFSRAQEGGRKVFESLVQQGQALESRTKQAATDTAAAARAAAQVKAKEMQAKAGGTWDKLEQVFEDRVARALSKLGVYTQNDVERLAERVDALSEAVNELIKATGVTPKAPKSPKTARKTVRTASKPKAAKSTPGQ